MQNPKFKDLILNSLFHNSSIVARMYSNGLWHQFSGKDLCVHLALGVRYWQNLIGSQTKKKTIIFIASNSYHSFIAGFSAVLFGFDIVWLPIHLSTEHIKEVILKYQCIALATDVEGYVSHLKEMSCPIIGIDKVIWMNDDLDEINHLKNFHNLMKKIYGRFQFVSIKKDQTLSYHSVYMDNFLQVAQSFINHIKAPKNIHWNSFEVMSLDHPFVHISKFCCLLQKGIIGFPNYESDLETSLSVLQPTFLFASKSELEHISNIFQCYSKQPTGQAQRSVKKGLKLVQKYLHTSKAMKIPENIFSRIKHLIRVTSKITSSSSFISTGLENLEFIVHGYSPASKKTVQFFEMYGVPIIETYGTIDGAGLLSSNTYTAPYINTIGIPLSHVYFRLGAQSTLSYKVSLDYNNLEKQNDWIDTGDVTQMTPFGLMLTGRKKYSEPKQQVCT